MKTQGGYAKRGILESLRRIASFEEGFSYTCTILTLYVIKYNSYLKSFPEIIA